jgi:hypothetical protein
MIMMAPDISRWSFFDEFLVEWKSCRRRNEKKMNKEELFGWWKSVKKVKTS